MPLPVSSTVAPRAILRPSPHPFCLPGAEPRGPTSPRSLINWPPVWLGRRAVLEKKGCCKEGPHGISPRPTWLWTGTLVASRFFHGFTSSHTCWWRRLCEGAPAHSVPLAEEGAGWCRAGGGGASYTALRMLTQHFQFGFSAPLCLTNAVPASKSPVFNPSVASVSWVDSA